MNNFLIEPFDLLFFRNALPMAAGQGKGEGCRLPFPSTVHEALRASLLIESNKICYRKSIPGRPRKAIRKGNWHSQSNESDVYVASKYFRSLCTRGPFPFLKEKGMLLPIPLDVMISKNKGNVLAGKKDDKIKEMVLFWNSTLRNEFNNSDDFTPYCLPVPVVPPNKESQLKGWWTLQQFSNYLKGDLNFDFTNVPDEQLWKSEYRVGIKIDPEIFTAAENQIYASSYMRVKDGCSLLCQVELKDACQEESETLQRLNWILIGGEQRLAKIEKIKIENDKIFTTPVISENDKPVLLKWVLVTPSIFANGILPGWCQDTSQRGFEKGSVCFDEICSDAFLISYLTTKPITFSGFDVVEGKAKDTLLCVPHGSVYYFLCRNGNTANKLAEKLHWKPRSDYYGEKGFGYGFVSFDVKTSDVSEDIAELAKQLFK